MNSMAYEERTKRSVKLTMWPAVPSENYRNAKKQGLIYKVRGNYHGFFPNLAV